MIQIIVQLTFHDKLAIITEYMPKKRHRLQPLPSPLFRPIGPSASPFGLAPWIADDEKTFALYLNGS